MTSIGNEDFVFRVYIEPAVVLIKSITGLNLRLCVNTLSPIFISIILFSPSDVETSDSLSKQAWVDLLLINPSIPRMTFNKFLSVYSLTIFLNSVTAFLPLSGSP